MTRFDVAVLAFRILALYFLLETARSTSQFVVILAGDWTEPVPVLAWTVPLALLAVLGVLVFWKAPAIARSIFPGSEPMSSARRPEIGMLALRICGILLLADFLPGVGRMLDSRSGPDLVRDSVTFAQGALAVLLFLAAAPLSRRLFGAARKPMAQPLLAHVQAVTFAVLGIWLLVGALPQLAEAGRERIQIGQWGRDSWVYIALAVLGLLLFLGGAGMSASWHWIRNAGLGARPGPSG